MQVQLSKAGQKMDKLSGVRAIMKDINETLAGNTDGICNLSAGNPVILPEVETAWKKYTQKLLDSSEFANVVCRYGSSKGYEPLIQAIIKDFNQRYNLKLTSKNILITGGSQTLYFIVANVYGGLDENGQMKKIVLPLSPDYTGYGGISLYENSLVSFVPNITTKEAEHKFKYHPNFDKLLIDQTSGCVIFSRPANPSGNIITDEEVHKIANAAKKYSVPVFVDSAYATPYPGLNFTEMNPVFGDNIVHCISLSKGGLPGERVGIAIGPEEIIAPLEHFQMNCSIHSSRYGQAIAAMAIESGEMAKLADQVIRPFYKNKFEIFYNALDRFMPKDLPWYVHEGEGSIFGWLWLKDLPITDWELYQILKKEKVLVVPGKDFFPGLTTDWKHKNECIRISLTASKEEIEKGVKVLADVIKNLYIKS